MTYKPVNGLVNVGIYQNCRLIFNSNRATSQKNMLRLTINVTSALFSHNSDLVYYQYGSKQVALEDSMCDQNQIENEIHFMFHCSLYNETRQTVLSCLYEETIISKTDNEKNVCAYEPISTKNCEISRKT